MSSALEQAEDECQQWSRTIRLISNRIGREEPKDVVFSRSAPSRCVCMSLNLSRFVRTAAMKVCDEMEAKRLAIDRLRESQRHLQADLRYAQEKMQLYAEKAQSLNSCDNNSAAEIDNHQEELLLNSKSVANNRAKALEARVESQELEIQRLRQKLQATEKVELHRQRRQEEVFRSLKLRKPTRNSPLDNKILDIIDSYENELRRLKQSRLNPPDAKVNQDVDENGEALLIFRDDEKEEDETEASASNGYRAIVEELRRQTAELADEVEKLQAERDALSTELQSRPTNSDHVLLVSKLQRYERLLKRHCIDPNGGKEAQPKEFSTKIEHIDMLPLSQCQKYLKETSQLLAINDLKEIREAVSDLLSISEAYGIVHPVLLQAEKLTQDPDNAPAIPDSVRLEFGSDRFQCLLPVLEHWRSQLVLLPELGRSVQRLCSRLFPWASAELTAGNGCQVKQLIAFVDKMSSDDCFDLAPSCSTSESKPPYSLLLGIVDHFRRLFEVNAVQAVLTKMNSVYAELGSTTNALTGIKAALGMEQRCQPEAVVQTVAYLLALERQSINAKLQEIFSEEDVQSAIDKLEDYEQFFPIFEELVKNLMAVLDVKRIDEILPEVTAHKRVIDAELVKHF